MSFTLINPPELLKNNINQIVYITVTKPIGELSASESYNHGLSFIPLFISGYADEGSVSTFEGTFPLDFFIMFPDKAYTNTGNISYLLTAKATSENVTLFIDIPTSDPASAVNVSLTARGVFIILNQKMPSS